MFAALFSQDGMTNYLLIGIALLVLLLIAAFGFKEKPARGSRAALLADKYRQMTPQLLREAPEDEVVDAVIANLHEKLDPHFPNPYATIPALSPGRSAVYAVWLLCNELDNDGWEAFYATSSAIFDELARDGLLRIGAAQCAAVVDRVLAFKPIRGENEALAQLHADFLEAVEAEQPLALCRQYILDNVDEFCDEP